MKNKTLAGNKSALKISDDIVHLRLDLDGALSVAL